MQWVSMLNYRLFVVALAFLDTPLGEKTFGTDKQDAQEVSFDYYLAKVGGNLDCRFTVERCESSREGQQPSAFDAPHMEDQRNVKTVQELIRKLRTEFKGVTVLPDRDNPKIVHLVEDPLIGKKDYVMTKQASIDFKGTLYELPEALSVKVGGISPRLGRAIPTEMFDDFTTKVKIHARNQSIRQIITNIIPLNSYGRLLWIAETSESKGKLSTVVQYYGPKEKPEKRSDP